MKIQEFGEILRNNIRVNIEELLKSLLHYLYFGIIKYPRNEVFGLLSKLNEVFHCSELLLRQLLVVQHLEALIVENRAPTMLHMDEFGVNFPHIGDQSLEVFDAMLIDKLTELLLLIGSRE